MPPSRHFSPPWIVDDNGACFIVRDHNGQALAYVYFEEEPGRRAAANLLARDEARRIALNIAKLPTIETAAILAGGKFSGWQWRSPRYFSYRSGSGGSL